MTGCSGNRWGGKGVLQRGGDGGDKVACGQAGEVAVGQGDVGGKAVQPSAESGGGKWRVALREEGGDDAGEDVAAAAFGEPGVSGRVDEGIAVRRADDALFAFEDDNRVQAGGEIARGGDAFAVVRKRAAGEADKFARMRGEDACRWQFFL